MKVRDFIIESLKDSKRTGRSCSPFDNSYFAENIVYAIEQYYDDHGSFPRTSTQDLKESILELLQDNDIIISVTGDFEKKEIYEIALKIPFNRGKFWDIVFYEDKLNSTENYPIFKTKVDNKEIAGYIDNMRECMR